MEMTMTSSLPKTDIREGIHFDNATGFGNSILNGWLDGLQSIGNKAEKMKIVAQITYQPKIQTGLRALSSEHPHTSLSFLSLQSLHLKQVANSAEEIISNPSDPAHSLFLQTALWNMLQITAHPHYCFKYRFSL